MKYVGIGHVGLRVGDMQRERAFYEKALRLPEVCAVPGEDGQTRIVLYRLPSGQLIELIRAEGGYDGRNVKGVQFWDGPSWKGRPRQTPFPAEPEANPLGAYSFFVNDPEGNQIEFMQYAPDSILKFNP